MVKYFRENLGVFVDCGEGTYGQLYRHYGDGRCQEILRAAGAVFVTHLHADHHTVRHSVIIVLVFCGCAKHTLVVSDM